MKRLCYTILVVVTVGNAQTGWDYPVKPGSTEWKTLSFAGIVRVQQIPPEILA